MSRSVSWKSYPQGKYRMMEDSAPVISVLMGVFNCAKTLDESLECLIAQSEERWECVICDDGSTDDTWKIIQKWQIEYPNKIHSLRNKTNKGLSHSLNRCLDEAKGEFAARMDGDDLCSPDRFEKELHYLRENPQKSIVSVDMQCFDENGVWGMRAYPTEPQPEDLVHGTPFCHAGCMVKVDDLRIAGGYSEDEKFARVEDYELWGIEAGTSMSLYIKCVMIGMRHPAENGNFVLMKLVSACLRSMNCICRSGKASMLSVR